MTMRMIANHIVLSIIIQVSPSKYVRNSYALSQ